MAPSDFWVLLCFVLSRSAQSDLGEYMLDRRNGGHLMLPVSAYSTSNPTQ